MSTSGQCCDVYGFHDDFKGIEDVTIAILATGIKISTDVCTFWNFNRALYFGEILDHSLINTNQIRHYGIPVSDNPYNSGQDFGIDHEDQFINFKTEGSTLF